MDQNGPCYDTAEVGDRITVEYATPEVEARRAGISGEVVSVDTNANGERMNTWFVGQDGYLYRLGANYMERTPERYSVQSAKEKLSGFDQGEIPASLMRVDRFGEPNQAYDSVEVVYVEPQDESDDYDVMTDYELQAAALQEAREGTLSDAFDALLERQERTHADFIRTQAYESDRRKSDELRIRSDRLRTGLKDALDTAND